MNVGRFGLTNLSAKEMKEFEESMELEEQMKLQFTFTELTVVCDALYARLYFGEGMGVPYRFSRKDYERVLQKVYASGAITELEILPKEGEGEEKK